MWIIVLITSQTFLGFFFLECKWQIINIPVKPVLNWRLTCAEEDQRDNTRCGMKDYDVAHSVLGTIGTMSYYDF